MSMSLENTNSDHSIPSLVIKPNNCASNDPCGICGGRTDPHGGYDVFLEGTQELVCIQCTRKYAPEMLGAVEVAVNELQADRGGLGVLQPCRRCIKLGKGRLAAVF